MSFRTLIIIWRRLADATGDPLIKIATSKAPSATELEGRELSARRKAIDRALACLQVSSNLINREDLVRLVAHLVTFGPLLLGWSNAVSCHKMA